jgi:uncharacterized membrane-anchored protein
MTQFIYLLRRIPKALLFVAAGLIQIGMVGAMVIDRASILREGTEITLQTRPIDPRDLLRGDYVMLGYAISNVSSPNLIDQPSNGKNTQVYVKLAPNAEGFHVAVSVDREPIPVSGAEVLIRGRVTRGADCGKLRRSFCGSLGVNYGIERYFVPEGEGRAIEQARNRSNVTVVAAVARDGRATIKRLLMDGRPIYDEPLF